MLNKAKQPYDGPDKRTKWLYRCDCCGELFKGSEVSVDHIIPAGSLNCFDDLAGFCQRLFCGEDDLQVLCTKGCHAQKTAEERKTKDD